MKNLIEFRLIFIEVYTNTTPSSTTDHMCFYKKKKQLKFISVFPLSKCYLYIEKLLLFFFYLLN